MIYYAIHKGGKIMKYVCRASNCELTFTTRREYKDHLQQVHAHD